MSNWSAFTGGRASPVHQYDNAVLISPSGSANTKGSWTELVSSTPHSADEINVRLSPNGVDSLWDIGIGAAASEVVICPNLYAGGVTVVRPLFPYRFPIKIPAGTRIAVRNQASTGGLGGYAAVTLHKTNRPSFGRVTEYGVSTANSYGTTINPGATPNTKGSWAELTSGLTRAIKGFIVAGANQGNGARVSALYGVDIGIGGSGSEVALLSNLAMGGHANSDAIFPTASEFFAISIPAGTRISARCSCDGASLTMGVAFYGVE